MEQPTTSNKESIVISQENCRREAQELLNKHQAEIISNIGQEVDGVKPFGEPYPNLLEENLRSIPPEILSRYWSHGITRRDDLDQLTAGISILHNSFIKGDTARLANSGHIDAYPDGSFLLVSKKDKSLIPGETFEDRKAQRVILGERSDGSPDAAIKVEIGALIVNTKFYPLVEDLRLKFPGIEILYARQVAEYFSR